MEFKEKLNFIGSVLSHKGFSGFANLAHSAMALLREPEVVGFSPVFAQIEPTVECNLQCPMCISPSLQRDVRTLSLECFEQIVEQLPFLQKVSLVGAGEPLLNPQLFEIIAFAKSRSISVGFATNATLLDRPTCDKIVSSGLDWLNISLDAASKKTYEGIRKGADFQRVLENIRTLVAAAQGKKPKISVWFLAMEKNINELPETVELCSRLGINRMYVQTVQYWGSQSWKQRLQGQRIDAQGVAQDVLYLAKRMAHRQNIVFDYVNIPRQDGGRLCKWPWKTCYITTDGYITPCCIHGADPKVINFGNIFEQGFKEIWNNKAYQQFRAQLKTKDIPAICRDCPSYYQKVEI